MRFERTRTGTSMLFSEVDVFCAAVDTTVVSCTGGLGSGASISGEIRAFWCVGTPDRTALLTGQMHAL
ncbi:hypothetical protein PanWU01x14_017980, partial [Parasponia andersonii]